MFTAVCFFRERHPAFYVSSMAAFCVFSHGPLGALGHTHNLQTLKSRAVVFFFPVVLHKAFCEDLDSCNDNIHTYIHTYRLCTFKNEFMPDCCGERNHHDQSSYQAPARRLWLAILVMMQEVNMGLKTPCLLNSLSILASARRSFVLRWQQAQGVMLLLYYGLVFILVNREIIKTFQWITCR